MGIYSSPVKVMLLFRFSYNSDLWFWSIHKKTISVLLYRFLGHNKAVRDICFNNDGTSFLSAAYDRYCKMWDTETGLFYFSFFIVVYVFMFKKILNFLVIFMSRSMFRKIHEQEGSILCEVQSRWSTYVIFIAQFVNICKYCLRNGRSINFHFWRRGGG